jgi:hypothetical protein
MKGLGFKAVWFQGHVLHHELRGFLGVWKHSKHALCPALHERANALCPALHEHANALCPALHERANALSRLQMSRWLHAHVLGSVRGM